MRISDWSSDVCSSDLVADGRKMLFFRNQGDAAQPDLVVEHAREQINPPDREQSTDAPGSAFSSNGSGRSSHQETDFHQLEEDRFAVETAAMLKQRAFANERSEEHTSELQSLMRISYAVFCLKKKP